MSIADQTSDDEGTPLSSCINRSNMYHRCTPLCVEISSCDSACQRAKHKQQLHQPQVVQALYASLPGSDQSTPRTEARAMFRALKHGISPQLVISDHINHVRDFISFAANARKSPLDPKKPNVDIWRNTIVAILERGGLEEIRPDRIWMAWKRLHTRASRKESQEDRNWRWGNAAADFFANLGRDSLPHS